MEFEFSGETHVAALRRLEAAVADMEQSPSPRVVLLQGPSGVGKSRIVREFYEAMRQRLPGGDPYWPPLREADENCSSDPLHTRKVLAPPTAGFTWPADALPTFTWWEFRCQGLDAGDLLNVLQQAESNIAVHSLPATLSIHAHLGRLKSFRHKLIEEIRVGLRESREDLIQEILTQAGLALPGAGWIVYGGKKAVQIGRETSERRARLESHDQSGARMTNGQDDEAMSHGKVIRDLVSSDVPGVVVIEDLHKMGPELARLLDELLSGSAPILVVGTVWPEGVEAPAYANWRDSRRDGGVPVEVISIPGSDIETRKAWIMAAAPNTSVEVATAVAQKYMYALQLRLFLSLEPVVDQIAAAGGMLELSEHDLGEYPDDIEGLLKRRWVELPKPVRRALAVASGVLPVDSGQLEVIDAIVAEAAIEAGLYQNDTIPVLVHSLDKAARPHEWVDVVNEGTKAFKEDVLKDIALLSVPTLLGAPASRKLREATKYALCRRMLAGAETSGGLISYDDEFAAQWLLNLVGKGTRSASKTVQCGSPGEAIAALTVAEAMVFRGRNIEACASIEHVDWTSAFADQSGEVIGDRTVRELVLLMRQQIADWLDDAGLVAQAVQDYSELLAEFADCFGQLSRESIYLRRRHAHSLHRIGDSEGALELTKELLKQLGARPSGDAQDDVDILCGNRAGYLSELGDLEGALEAYTALIGERSGRSDMPPNDQTIMLWRSNRARFLKDLGRGPESRHELEDLLRIYGDADESWHVSALLVKEQYGELLCTMGDAERGLTQIAEAIAEHEASWPTRITERLRMRASYAKSRLDAATPTEAEVLLDDLTRVLAESEASGVSDLSTEIWMRSLVTQAALKSGSNVVAVAQGRLAYRDLQSVNNDEVGPTTALYATRFMVALSTMSLWDESISVASELLAMAGPTLCDSDGNLLRVRALRDRALFHAGSIAEAAANAEMLSGPMSVSTAASDTVFVDETLRLAKAELEDPTP